MADELKALRNRVAKLERQMEVVVASLGIAEVETQVDAGRAHQLAEERNAAMDPRNR